MPRKAPFSGKQKKQQLRDKRQRKQNTGPHYGGKPPVGTNESDSGSDTESAQIITPSTNKDGGHSSAANEDGGNSSAANKRASVEKGARGGGRDRYKLQFHEMSRGEALLKKEESMQPYLQLSPEGMEYGMEAFYDPPIMFPIRPKWDHSLNRTQLEQQEQRYFQSYGEKFLQDHSLGYVELNLETWRQLWRVLEMSDILLHIVDVRYAALHFNPALFTYITQQSKKVIVVLNKCDIVPPQVAIAWKHYLLNEYPGLEVVIFTSFPKDEVTRDLLKKGKQNRRRKRKALAVGPLDLWNVCNKLVKEEINIDSWKAKIQEDMKVYTGDNDDDSDQSDCEVEGDKDTRAKPELGFVKHQKYRDGVLTIGCVGYPNVGKSAVINGLMGRKVVSVSRTPGHTKHFQTIFLTPNVKLCDCPGLVFPSTAPREIQVLAGMYPIAQVREPYSVVQYIAERCDLPASLGVRLKEDEDAWSAYLICDELAELKGFKTARGARTDPYRAANWILRSALEGKILLYLLPPMYNSRAGYWSTHADTKWLLDIQLERLTQSGENPAGGVKVKPDNSQSDESSADDDDSDAPVASTNAFALLGDE